MYELSNNDLTAGYKFVSDDSLPTCRSTDMAYQKDVNYTVVIDGFIVSDNIQVIEANVVSQGNDLFLYSDHNPVTMEFRFN